jgi:serine/threonine protein kinase
MIGRVVKGKYKIYDEVGSGGFATVYLGRNMDTNEIVAIKVLNRQYTVEDRYVERFRREARLAERLQHPNVIRVFDHGIEDGMHFLVMEFVEGLTLDKLIKRKGSLSIEETLSYSQQACAGLQAAHEAGIVHRDIKPANLMITPAGVLKIMDFGIARVEAMTGLTQSGMFMGTPRYISPEMATGSKADIRSDLYALGLLIYEMLTGAPPFDADNPWAVLRQQIETDPAPLHESRADVPSWLEAVAFKALAKDPADRFQTPADMLAALQQQTPAPSRVTAAATPTIIAAAVPAAKAEKRQGLPKGVIVGLAGLAAIIVLGLLAFLVLGGGEDKATPTPLVTVIVAQPNTTTPTPEPTDTPQPSDTPLPTPTETVAPTDTATPQPTDTPPPTDTATPQPTDTSPPTPTETSLPPSDTPPPTNTPRPAAPASTRTPTPTRAPTSPPPAAVAGRIAFSVVDPSGSFILYSISASGTDERWLGDNLRQPSYRQDGKMIVANGQGGGREDLWKVSPDGSGTVSALGKPEDEDPIWLQSTSGFFIGFGSTRHGDGQWRLYLEDEAIFYGSGAIRGRFPVRLPGEKVAYAGCDYGFGSSSNCGLFVVSMWGGIPTQITGEPNDIPTDGGSAGVLFMRQVEGNMDVYLIGAGGGAPRRLTDHTANDGLATFSPDGRMIAFLSNRSGNWALWLMGRDGSNQRKIYDLPYGGGYGANWTLERLSWGPLPSAPTPVPTPKSADLLPAPQISFPIPEDRVSVSRATTVRWTWTRSLAANQGFQVRFWNASDASPMGVAPPTSALEMAVNFGLTESYRRHGATTYYLDVVVVALDTNKVLSNSAPIQVIADPNK